MPSNNNRQKFRQLSLQKRAEIARAWSVYWTITDVAIACGVTFKTARKYRPDSVRKFSARLRLPAEKIEQIRKAWQWLKTAKEVAAECQVSERSAYRFSPRSDKPCITYQGYSTWSEETRNRWDDFWDDPSRAQKARVYGLFHWNDGWLKPGRADLHERSDGDDVA